MSGLKYLLSKSPTNQTEESIPECSLNFQAALNKFVGFCEKRLPQIFSIDFMPMCFDISKDNETLIIGGHYGNIASYSTKGAHI